MQLSDKPEPGMTPDKYSPDKIDTFKISLLAWAAEFNIPKASVNFWNDFVRSSRLMTAKHQYWNPEMKLSGQHLSLE